MDEDKFTKEIKIPEGVESISFHDDVLKPRLRQSPFSTSSIGYVAVRLAGKDETKTYLGLYLGDLSITAAMYERDNKLYVVPGHPNPCIYVPDLRRFVYGMESWWGELENPDDLKQITDADINNVWYVQAR